MKANTIRLPSFSARSVESANILSGVEDHCLQLAEGIHRQLARISHGFKRIGAPNQRKLFCENDFLVIRGEPRCRQSAPRICLDLKPSRSTARLSEPSAHRRAPQSHDPLREFALALQQLLPALEKPAGTPGKNCTAKRKQIDGRSKMSKRHCAG